MTVTYDMLTSTNSSPSKKRRRFQSPTPRLLDSSIDPELELERAYDASFETTNGRSLPSDSQKNPSFHPDSEPPPIRVASQNFTCRWINSPETPPRTPSQACPGLPASSPLHPRSRQSSTGPTALTLNSSRPPSSSHSSTSQDGPYRSRSPTPSPSQCQKTQQRGK